MKICNIQEILYEEDGFIIAQGDFQGEPNNIMMKWENYPIRGWLVIPKNLHQPILRSILSLSGSNRDNILNKLV